MRSPTGQFPFFQKSFAISIRNMNSRLRLILHKPHNCSSSHNRIRTKAEEKADSSYDNGIPILHDCIGHCIGQFHCTHSASSPSATGDCSVEPNRCSHRRQLSSTI